jgi:hypothetical protein
MQESAITSSRFLQHVLNFSLVYLFRETLGLLQISAEKSIAY